MRSEKKEPKRETGWDKLRQENEGSYIPNFGPIRSAIRRNELFGSIVELFVTAVVGVSKLNLGAKEPSQEGKIDSPK